jgi:hypothetical protein
MNPLSARSREKLKNKIAAVLSDNIKTLSPVMQEILLDDLITAFESRLAVMNRAESSVQCFVGVGVKIPNETV